ncbi:cyclic GMP-AMP synthase [Ochotona princeps]|uniref:cyclic GMP-AMP synthase n=1 Tax=Ochotona princeps TaxID=9978 RepID=UPI0027147068|nr:cyclic GMP-AMP synthase [Ochotona princeps]
MDSRRGKKTRASSTAGNAAPNASAQGVRDAPTQPAADTASMAAAALRAAPSKAGDGGPARESVRQRKNAQSPREKTEVRAPRSCAKRASLCAEAPAPQASAATVLTERQSVPLEAEEPPEAPVACLPKAGSRSRKGARSSCTEQRPPLGPSKELCPGGAVQVPNVSQSEVAWGSWNSKEVLDKLRLKREEISVAAKIVNRVVDQLLHRLQRVESEFKRVTLLNTGSYYEHVKISAPDEFDVMFKLEVPRVMLEEYPKSDAHYFVKFKRNPQGSPLDQFLEPDRRLSASRMLSKFRKIITEEIKNITDVDVAVEKKRRGSPAVTLIITQPREISVDIILALQPCTSWPACTQEGLPIERWLGSPIRRQLRQKPFYLVPKHAKEGNSFQEETWRLSFSNIEKDILSDHGQSKVCCQSNGNKCCRKDCLKLMKYLLEQLKKKFENQKKLDKFCSYHVKTAFFHTCTQHPSDDEWCPENVSVSFNNCVEYFLCCLRTERLKHYFIPTVNLFSQDQIDKKSKDFLLEQIEYERNNGYPVFSEF